MRGFEHLEKARLGAERHRQKLRGQFANIDLVLSSVEVAYTLFLPCFIKANGFSTNSISITNYT